MEIVIHPRHLTHSRAPFEPTHLLSLQDPGTDVSDLRPSWIPRENHLVAFFLDARSPVTLGGPSLETLRPVIAWLRDRCGRDSTDRLLIHCHAGLGRSPAVGYLAWAMHLGVGREMQAWENMRRSCSQLGIVPNGRVIELGAALLGRRETLLEPYLTWATGGEP